MNSPFAPCAGPSSVCILRLSALGDVINVVPVVRAIQARWPETPITWVIGRLERRLLAHMDDVRFVEFDKRAGPRAYRALWETMRGRSFDVLLHAQVSARANLAATLIRAQRRIGYDRRRAREGHGLVVRERIAPVPFQHQVQGFLEFARKLELTVQEPRWNIPLSEADREFARRVLPEDRQGVLISPCSSHPGRNWSPGGYASVADWVLDQGAGPVVLMGGPGEAERHMAAQIEQAMRHRPVNLVGKDTLTQALAVLERGRLLVAPDSGPVHMARAMGTPVVGLYAATWARRSGPWGSLAHCVDRFPQAARKFRDTAPEALRWGTRIEVPGVMDLIEVGEVLNRVSGLLEETAPEGR